MQATQSLVVALLHVFERAVDFSDDVNDHRGQLVADAVVRVNLRKHELSPLVDLLFVQLQTAVEHDQDNVALSEVMLGCHLGPDQCARSVDKDDTKRVDLFVLRLDRGKELVTKAAEFIILVLVLERQTHEAAEDRCFSRRSRTHNCDAALLNLLEFLINSLQFGFPLLLEHATVVSANSRAHLI